MGVLIGDEKVTNFPSIVVAASDELYDRAKNKFYEKKFNLLSRVPACISEFASQIAQKIDDGSFLLDARVFRIAVYHRSLLLDVKKVGDITHRLFYGFLN